MWYMWCSKVLSEFGLLLLLLLLCLFLVHGLGPSTSFYVTSLYIDATLLRGTSILKCDCRLFAYIKKKKKKKAVKFHYWKLITMVKYLLQQKAYVDDVVWGPHPEYDKEGNTIDSEIDMRTR